MPNLQDQEDPSEVTSDANMLDAFGGQILHSLVIGIMKESSKEY